MMHDVAAAALTIGALAIAAIVELHGGDPQPYIGVALVAGGYGTGSAVAKARNRNS